MPVEYFRWYIFAGSKLKQIWLKNFKSIITEQINVIRGLIHAIQWCMVTFWNHTPPAVPFAKINRPSIAYIPFCCSQFLAVSSKNCRLPGYWCIKNPHRPPNLHRLLFYSGGLTNAAIRRLNCRHHLSYPAGGFTKTKVLFFFAVEYIVNVLSSGCIQLGSFLYNWTATLKKSMVSALVTSIICILQNYVFTGSVSLNGGDISGS